MSVVIPFPAEKEYEKNPDISREEIRKFREWLDSQPHLPGHLITELDLIVTYHCCDNSIEVAKQVLDLHFTLRTLFHGFFKDRCYEPRVDAALQTVLFAQLPPTASVLNYRVFYMRLLQLDPKDFNFTDVSRVFMMTFDLAQLEEGTWPGFVMMIDMDQATLGHIGRLEVMTLKKVLHFLQECMLVKLREIHFINAPSFIDRLMMLLRPFLSKKLMDIIYIHPIGTDSINKYIVKDCMPKEDGGSFKSREILRDELIQRLKANQAFFRDENLRRVVESRRPGGSSRASEEYGMQGSFKKLDLD